MPIYKVENKQIEVKIPSNPELWVKIKGNYKFPDRSNVYREAIKITPTEGEGKINLDLPATREALIKIMVVDHNFEDEKGKKLTNDEIIQTLNIDDADAILAEIDKVVDNGALTKK